MTRVQTLEPFEEIARQIAQQLENIANAGQIAVEQHLPNPLLVVDHELQQILAAQLRLREETLRILGTQHPLDGI